MSSSRELDLISENLERRRFLSSVLLRGDDCDDFERLDAFRILTALCRRSPSATVEELEEISAASNSSSAAASFYPNPFSPIVTAFRDAEAVELRTEILRFVNSLLEEASTKAERVKFRRRLKCAGFYAILESICCDADEALRLQKEVFVARRNVDSMESEMTLSGSVDDAFLLVEDLLDRLPNAQNQNLLTSILRQLRRLDQDEPLTDVLWSTLHDVVGAVVACQSAKEAATISSTISYSLNGGGRNGVSPRTQSRLGFSGVAELLADEVAGSRNAWTVLKESHRRANAECLDCVIAHDTLEDEKVSPVHAMTALLLKETNSSHDDLTARLREADAAAIGAKDLRRLKELAAELQRVGDDGGEHDDVDEEIGNFLKDLQGIANVEILVDALLYELEFETMVDHLRSALDALISTARDLRKNEALPRLFDLLLRARRVPKSGRTPATASAAGFRLESLLTIADSPSLCRETSVIRLVVLALERRGDPDSNLLLHFWEGLPRLREATLYPLRSLEKRVRLVGVAMDRIRRLSSPPRRLLDFLVELKSAKTFLLSEVADARKQEEELASFFCVDVADFDLDDCFRTIYAFSVNLRRTAAEISAERAAAGATDQSGALRDFPSLDRIRRICCPEEERPGSGMSCSSGGYGPQNSPVDVGPSARTKSRSFGRDSASFPFALRRGEDAGVQSWRLCLKEAKDSRFDSTQIVSPKFSSKFDHVLNDGVTRKMSVYKTQSSAGNCDSYLREPRHSSPKAFAMPDVESAPTKKISAPRYSSLLNSDDDAEREATGFSPLPLRRSKSFKNRPVRGGGATDEADSITTALAEQERRDIRESLMLDTDLEDRIEARIKERKLRRFEDELLQGGGSSGGGNSGGGTIWTQSRNKSFILTPRDGSPSAESGRVSSSASRSVFSSFASHFNAEDKFRRRDSPSLSSAAPAPVNNLGHGCSYRAFRSASSPVAAPDALDGLREFRRRVHCRSPQPPPLSTDINSVIRQIDEEGRAFERQMEALFSEAEKSTMGSTPSASSSVDKEDEKRCRLFRKDEVDDDIDEESSSLSSSTYFKRFDYKSASVRVTKKEKAKRLSADPSLSRTSIQTPAQTPQRMLKQRQTLNETSPLKKGASQTILNKLVKGLPSTKKRSEGDLLKSNQLKNTVYKRNNNNNSVKDDDNAADYDSVKSFPASYKQISKSPFRRERSNPNLRRRSSETGETMKTTTTTTTKFIGEKATSSPSHGALRREKSDLTGCKIGSARSNAASASGTKKNEPSFLSPTAASKARSRKTPENNL